MNIPQRLRKLADSTGLDAFGDEIRAIADEMDACGSAGTQSDPQAGLTFTGATQPADVTDEQIHAVFKNAGQLLDPPPYHWVESFARSILALQASTQVQATQPAKVTDEQIINLASQIADGSWGPVGEIEEAYQFEPPSLLVFARSILALQASTQVQATQPAKVTDEQIRSMCKQGWVFETVKQWVSVIEAHHGITALAKKETP